MKDSRTLIIRQFSILGAATALAILFMGLPFLAAARIALANKIGLAADGLWIPLGAALLGGAALLARQLIRAVAAPLRQLAADAEQDQLSYAFKRPSRVLEEDIIKHLLENRFLQLREVNDRAERLDKDLERANEKLDRYRKAAQTAEAQLDELQKNHHAIRVENETLKSSNMALELTLDNERQSKVGREVEKRADEIYAQMERALAAESFRSLWVPQLVAELREPVVRIQDLSTAITQAWGQTSLARLQSSIEAIAEHATTQIRALDALHGRSFEVPPRAKAQPMAETESASVAPASPPPAAPQPRFKLSLPSVAAAAAPITDAASELTIEAETLASAPAIKAELVSETEDDTNGPSRQDLRSLLGNLVDEYSTMDTDARFQLALDPELDVQIDGAELEMLLRNLLNLSVSMVDQGSIALEVSRERNCLQFDIACQGEIEDADAIDLRQATDLASGIASELQCESESGDEVRFSFNYAFADDGKN